MSSWFRRVLICVFSFWGLVFAATHTVSKGDTLYSISRKYGMSVDELCRANGITEKDALRIGQKLSIPETVLYTVVEGDTLYSLGRNYGVSVDEIRSLNGLSATDKLKVGQTLKIPSKDNVVVSSSSPVVDKSVTTSMELSDPRNYSGKKGDSSLVWPVKNPDVVYVTGKISGVQLSAEKNEQVKAVRSGTVMFSGVYRGFGKVVFVQSQTGHMYVYTGLSEINVKKSDYVASGDALGVVGVDAISGKPQLTFMVFQNGTPIDPAKAPRG